MTETNFHNHKSPGSDQISAELIQAGGETLLSEICKLINSVWNKKELPIIVPVHKRPVKLTAVIIMG
jgi:hypothetical protein